MSYTDVIVAGEPVASKVPVELAQTWWPRYSRVDQAIDAAPQGGLVLVMPGTHNLNSSNSQIAQVAKPLAVIGTGDHPDDTIIRDTGINSHFRIQNGCSAVIENLQILSTSVASGRSSLIVQGSGESITALFNRVNFAHGHSSADTINNWSSGAPGAAVEYRHCTISRGRNTFVSYSGGRTVLHRVHTPPSLAISASSTSIPLANRDHSNDPAPDYGHHYGELTVAPPATTWLQQGLVAVPGSAAQRVCLFDWARPERYVVADISSGQWQAPVPVGVPFGIYYLSTDNHCPPIIHGPYTAEE